MRVEPRLLVLLVVACVAASPNLALSRNHPGFSGCGWAYEFTAGKRTITAGGCSGILPRDPIRMTIRVHQRLVVHIAHELGNGRLDYPVPVSTSHALRFLGSHRAIASYVAVRFGQARLLARHTPFCEATDPRAGTCVALKVRIVN